jgi:hypothetical protein
MHDATRRVLKASVELATEDSEVVFLALVALKH